MYGKFQIYHRTWYGQCARSHALKGQRSNVATLVYHFLSTKICKRYYVLLIQSVNQPVMSYSSNLSINQ